MLTEEERDQLEKSIETLRKHYGERVDQKPDPEDYTDAELGIGLIIGLLMLVLHNMDTPKEDATEQMLRYFLKGGSE